MTQDFIICWIRSAGIDRTMAGTGTRPRANFKVYSLLPANPTNEGAEPIFLARGALNGIYLAKICIQYLVKEDLAE